MQNVVLWDKCLSKLEDEISPRDFSTWVRPLYASNEDSQFILYAPNRFIKEWLEDNLLTELNAAAQHFAGEGRAVLIALEVPKIIKTEKPKLKLMLHKKMMLRQHHSVQMY